MVILRTAIMIATMEVTGTYTTLTQGGTRMTVTRATDTTMTHAQGVIGTSAKRVALSTSMGTRHMCVRSRLAQHMAQL